MNSLTKRILITLFILLIIFGLILLLWLWYLKQQSDQNTGSNSNTTATTNTTSVPAGQNPSSNTQIQVSPNGSSTLGSAGTNSSANSGTYAAGSYGAGATGGTTSAGGSFTGGLYGGNSGAGGGYTGNTYGSGTSGANTYGSGTYGIGDTGGGNNPGGYNPLPTSTSPTGATWIPGSGNPFNPTSVNSVNSSNPTGSGSVFSPNITSSGSGSSGSGGNSGLSTLLAGVAGAAACTPGLLGGGAAGTATVAAATAIKSAAASAAAGKGTGAGIAAGALGIGAVPVTNVPVEVATDISAAHAVSNSVRTNFLDCIARTAAKIALQRITASVVDWVNTGFHGSPTFIQNYQQFFSDVANQAAGSYIQGSSLSFLCSPFSLQVRIAVAQSYASQSGQSAQQQSCTLSSVSNNIDNFMKGDFSSGGWPALLSFTTVPTNNPFGAYLYGKIGLESSVLNAQQNASNNISPEGFINMQKVTCPNQPEIRAAGAPYQPPGTPLSGVKYNSYTNVTLSANSAASCPVVNGIPCHCEVTTPGSIIASTLSTQLNIPSQELNLAKNFDEIISALMQQLTTKALQGGVSNLSGQNGYQSNFLTPDQQQASAAAQTLLSQLQNDTAIAQQYGYAQQGKITDVQNVQAQLQTLLDCWTSAASSTVFSDAKRGQATANMTTTQDKMTALQIKVDTYNNEISKANVSIALLEQFQTRALSAASLAEIQSIQAQYTAARSSGTIFNANDIVTTQQDRTTLQAELSTIMSDTKMQLDQCYAFATQQTQ